MWDRVRELNEGKLRLQSDLKLAEDQCNDLKKSSTLASATIGELREEVRRMKEGELKLQSELQLAGHQRDDQVQSASLDASAIWELKEEIRKLKEGKLKMHSELQLARNQRAPLEAELECHRRHLQVMNAEAQDYKTRYMEERSRYEALQKEVVRERQAQGGELERVLVEAAHLKRVLEGETQTREMREKECADVRACVGVERERVASLETELRRQTRRCTAREEELSASVEASRKYGDQKSEEATFNREQALKIQNRNDHLVSRVTELEQECTEYRALVQKWVPNNAFVDLK